MRRISWIAPLLLLPAVLLPLRVLAQETLEGGEADTVTHPESGFSMVVPDGWDREPEREGAGVLVHAVYHASKGKQVRMEISVEATMEFDIDLWIENQREVKQDLFGKENITEAFSEYKDDTLGGLPARGFIIAGKTEVGDGKTYPLHYKVFGATNEDWFITVQQISYNGAHEESVDALEAFWSAIKLSEPKPVELDLTPPGEMGGATFTDKVGNIKLVKLPAGWQVVRGPPEEAASSLRLVAVRMDAEGRAVATLGIQRFLHGPRTFTEMTPTTYAEARKSFWASTYEHQEFEIEMDEGMLMGGAPTSGGFRLSGWTKQEQEEIKEAEDKQQRGEKVKVPDFPKTILKGRVALISPYGYIATYSTASPREAANATLNAELEQIFEDFQFFDITPGLGPLGNGTGGIVPVTTTDPANKNARKGELFRPEVKFVIPAGFIQSEEVRGDIKLELMAQDEKFNSVRIRVFGKHRNDLGPRERFPTKKSAYEQWKTSWENKAQRTGRLKDKPGSKQLGPIKCAHASFKGRVNKFPATFQGFFGIKYGWMIQVEIETRGTGDKIFKSQIKSFTRKFKLKND